MLLPGKTPSGNGNNEECFRRVRSAEANRGKLDTLGRDSFRRQQVKRALMISQTSVSNLIFIIYLNRALKVRCTSYALSIFPSFPMKNAVLRGHRAAPVRDADNLQSPREIFRI